MSADVLTEPPPYAPVRAAEALRIFPPTLPSIVTPTFWDRVFQKRS